MYSTLLCTLGISKQEFSYSKQICFSFSRLKQHLYVIFELPVIKPWHGRTALSGHIASNLHSLKLLWSCMISFFVILKSQVLLLSRKFWHRNFHGYCSFCFQENFGTEIFMVTVNSQNHENVWPQKFGVIHY